MDSALDILELDELVILANLDLEANNLSDALIKLKLAYKKGGKGELLAILARLYARLALFDKAKPLFAEYIRENPNAMVEKFQYGMTFFDSNDLEQALGIFNSILEHEPAHPPAKFYSSLVLLRKEDVKEATRRLEEILSTVDKENLFYQRAKEQLIALHPARAEEFSNLSQAVEEKPDDKVQN